RIFLLRIVHEMRSKLASLGFLAVTRCEGVNLATPFVRELQCHVAQSADADDTDTRSGPDIVDEKGREHGDAAAEQRSGGRRVEPVGDWANPGPLSPNAVSEGAVASEDRSLDRRAQMMVAGETFVA